VYQREGKQEECEEGKGKHIAMRISDEEKNSGKNYK
jgi:hypothetical protein